MDRKLPVKLPEGYLDFFKKLESWQNERQIYLKNECQFEQYDVLALLASKQEPLFHLKKIRFDSGKYKDTFILLLDFMEQERKETADTITTITKKTDALDYALLPTKVLEGDGTYVDQLAKFLGVSPDLLLFVADHSLRPFLRIAAQPYHETIAGDNMENWHIPAICPLCGSKSHFSRLRAIDGRRFMFCDRCFTEWESKYLQCVYCGNDEPGTVKYISVEGDDAYQIYTCDKCKGYIKTFDERQNKRSIDMYIANIETIYLDMLAQEKGYSNHDEG